MLKITDLVISPKSLGNKLYLVDVLPSYTYVDNQRTDNITAYRYVLTLPDRGFEKISVKIEGPQLLEKPDGYAEVRAENMEVYVYWSQGDYHVAARATNITLVHAKS